MPGPKCSACAHPKRGDAESAVASGLSVREVAKKFGLPYQSFDRHCRKCVPNSIQKAAEAKEVKHGGALLLRVERLQTATEIVLESAMTGIPLLDKKGNAVLVKGKPVMLADGVLALRAVAQGRRNLELVGRLTGELDPQKEERPLPTWAEFEAIYIKVRQAA
jgi:hypothetical protein